MTNRDDIIRALIQETEWQDWAMEAMGKDASSRRYFRLTDRAGSTVILADVPPKKEDYRQFLEVAEKLSNYGLAVPVPLRSWFHEGVFVISDLGQKTLAESIEIETVKQEDASDAVVEALRTIRNIDCETLPKLDASRMLSDLDPLFAHYGATGASAIRGALGEALENHVSVTLRFCLRDFHAENIIWREDLAGMDRLGLLDFQDAMAAPDGYDIASFTRDARRDVDVRDQRSMERAFARKIVTDPDTFKVQVAVLAIQRNLRILGIFARLIEDGKTKYQSLMPRVWGHILEDLKLPELRKLSEIIQIHLSSPTNRWGAQT